MTRSLLLAAFLLGCSGSAARDPGSCPVPDDPCCGLPRCEVVISDGACAGSGPVAEMRCDRPMATLDQDCANSSGPHVSCLAVTPAATRCDQPAEADGATWCCTSTE